MFKAGVIQDMVSDAIDTNDEIEEEETEKEVNRVLDEIMKTWTADTDIKKKLPQDTITESNNNKDKEFTIRLANLDSTQE